MQDESEYTQNLGIHWYWLYRLTLVYTAFGTQYWVSAAFGNQDEIGYTSWVYTAFDFDDVIWYTPYLANKDGYPPFLTVSLEFGIHRFWQITIINYDTILLNLF